MSLSSLSILLRNSSRILLISSRCSSSWALRACLNSLQSSDICFSCRSAVYRAWRPLFSSVTILISAIRGKARILDARRTGGVLELSFSPLHKLQSSPQASVLSTSFSPLHNLSLCVIPSHGKDDDILHSFRPAKARKHANVACELSQFYLIEIWQYHAWYGVVLTRSTRQEFTGLTSYWRWLIPEHHILSSNLRFLKAQLCLSMSSLRSFSAQSEWLDSLEGEVYAPTATAPDMPLIGEDHPTMCWYIICPRVLLWSSWSLVNLKISGKFWERWRLYYSSWILFCLSSLFLLYRRKLQQAAPSAKYDSKFKT